MPMQTNQLLKGCAIMTTRKIIPVRALFSTNTPETYDNGTVLEDRAPGLPMSTEPAKSHSPPIDATSTCLEILPEWHL